MATVNKDFRVKNGLVVEGSTATVNGNNIITDGDTTDVLDEGTSNLYYTDQRNADLHLARHSLKTQCLIQLFSFK